MKKGYTIDVNINWAHGVLEDKLQKIYLDPEKALMTAYEILDVENKRNKELKEEEMNDPRYESEDDLYYDVLLECGQEEHEKNLPWAKVYKQWKSKLPWHDSYVRILEFDIVE